MKVLHIGKWDDQGGASIGMLRLHKELLSKWINSFILCERSCGNVEQVELVSKGWRFQLGRVIERIIGYFVKLQKDNTLFFNSVNLRPNALLKRINELNPDIVHLHWVGLGVLRIEDLPKIRQPIVWTLHDMWAFCGSEHCNLDTSERWKNAYSRESRPTEARGIDLSRWVWRRKHKAWSNVAMTTVSPSHWMQQCATDSSLWKDNQLVSHKCVYNGLNVEVFKPIEKLKARSKLGLNNDLPVLLFGASSLHSHVKGGDLLSKALKQASNRELKFQLVTFGSGESFMFSNTRITHLGYLNDVSKLAEVYSAADVILMPSRMESFGQVASEALACGTPVLCFDTTGLKDVVEHKVCGYRAKCFSIEDFVDGLEWLLKSKNKAELNKAARDHVLNRFQISETTDAYIKLYSQVFETNL